MTNNNPTRSIGYAIVGALSGILVGLDIGIIGGSAQFIYDTFNITRADTFIDGLTRAAVPLGALIGALLSARVTRAVGRRNGLLVSAIIYTIGILAIGSAINIEFVIAGRTIMGIAVGLITMTAPMYLSEVSPRESRGTIVFSYQLAITMGIFLAYVVNYSFADTGDWRMMFYVLLAPILIYLACIPFLPRSPRWLVQKGRIDEARKVLQRVRKRDDVHHELDDIQESVAHMAASFKALFNRRLFPLVLITFLLFAFQQLSGINSVFYYIGDIFSAAGFDIQDAIFYSLLPGAVNVLASVAGIVLVELWGRRRLLFVGMAGIVISLGVLGADYNGLLGSLDSGMLSVICVLVFITFFAISLGGVAFVIMAEVFPLNIRHLGMSIASMGNWGFNLIVVFFFPYLTKFFGVGNAYWLFAACTVVGIIFVYSFIPETRNITLEAIENNLYAGKRLRELGHPVNV